MFNSYMLNCHELPESNSEVPDVPGPLPIRSKNFIYPFSKPGWWYTHPSEKYESQLGWWHSQYFWENTSHVPVTSNQISDKIPLNYHFPMVFLWFSSGFRKLLTSPKDTQPPQVCRSAATALHPALGEAELPVAAGALPGPQQLSVVGRRFWSPFQRQKSIGSLDYF